MSDINYSSEISFVKRKIPTIKINWKAMPAVSQIASPPMAPTEVQKVIASLRDSLGKKAVLLFNKMVFSATSKLSGGSRVIISIPVLREVFGSEIDNDFGGGGKSYNPFSNKPKPPGRGV